MSHRRSRISTSLLGLAVLLCGASVAFGLDLEPVTPPPANTGKQVSLDLKYSFGTKALAGFAPVIPGDAYSVEKGFGFDLGSTAVIADDAGAVSGQGGKPFFFSTKLEPGEYRVTVTLGGPAESVTTIKSESRRLMVEDAHVVAGGSETKSFLVHIRVPTIPGATGAAAIVAMKPREKNPMLYVSWDEAQEHPFLELDWDEKLTLEFSGEHAAVRAVEIAKAEKATTIYLVGDSTMTDQAMGPWTGWGQMLPRWFKEPVCVANYAESGETVVSFVGERRWPKLLSEIHAGDYVLMQFGINDRAIPLDRFKQTFVKLIKDTRDHGATPVLVTSQNLRKLSADGKGINTLGGYPDAMREVAKDENTPLIDLNAMSMVLYEAVGAEKLPKFFVDSTHQSEYGAYELSKCVVKAIIENKLPFAELVADDWKGFDPAHPDVMADFKMPIDPQLDPARPGGPGAKSGQGAMAAMPARPTATRAATRSGGN